ncbi:uncharacterized protein LY89DRAFT_273490 [Mollisia scopiformis]|uniref:Uncharacterized protein n=1 Tax=Mollisia scopiformis TaxID=149040 RepID=A0A132BB24_MOLSC|nr:uncharacterized protein LY89DRAFT_273490 [Mollisia scopiformis]KUJ09578.1 hypothetical protein LY89DRAFT_273490 [Mollisia scopiformis]
MFIFIPDDSGCSLGAACQTRFSFSNTSSSILYVNKKIHDEAIKIFFQYNTFVVGNGTEENEASLIGLKALTKYVPASLIGAISKLQFHVYLRTIDDLSQLPPRRRPWETEWTTLITPSAEVAEVLAQYEFLNSEPIPFRSGVNLSMGGPAEALEIRQIHRCIPKHFVNVTTVTVDWVVSSNKVQIWPGRIIPREATITVLSKAIKSLMQLPKLRQICMWEDECVYTEGIIERLLAEQGEMGKAIQFEHLRYNEGISGRIRREAEEQREIHLLWIA